MSPADIIARSVESAFGQPEIHYTRRHMAPVPPPPPPPPFPMPQQAPPLPSPHPGGMQVPGPFADFWIVWMEHHDYLFKQSMRFMAGNMADAEDALSQAMLKGSQHFDGELIRNQRAWLTRLVHNACMDQHRSHKRQARLSDEIDGDDHEQAPNITPQPIRTPDEALHMRQVFDQLESQLLKLPVSLLEPLLLRVVEEKSYDEIAGKMGLSNCAVRKRIQLARDRLRHAGAI
ncbi:MAG: RNA polymerase sigma factor [Magnetovibrio sp.]|nr:RNA polymerase sigma factor [Magnetovibrio sp.]